MADIDVLIPANAYSDVEAALLDRGYVKLADWNLPGHQHGAPLRHVRRRTIVELHTRLFREDSPLRTDGVFGESNVAAQSMRSRYHARPVKRLTPEMQLAYIASSWFNDLTLSKFHPSFIASLFDAIYLLKASGRTLDWRGLLGWLLRRDRLGRLLLDVVVDRVPGRVHRVRLRRHGEVDRRLGER